MLKIAIEADEIRFGQHLAVSFQRTLRIPDDGRAYPLPPGLGRLPIFQARDYATRLPRAWAESGGVFVPMRQREALWIAFDGADWHPGAVQIGVGGINAVSGQPWGGALTADPQDYLVCPDQPWLDGINVGQGVIRQFVAMPLGAGYTVEAQLTGKEEAGGIQVRVIEAKPGRFPSRPPRRRGVIADGRPVFSAMGLGAGGTMRQRIYPDAYGIETWDFARQADIHVHIVAADQFRAITGREPPPSPIDAATYTRHGFPWFELYDEERGAVAGSGDLAGVTSVRQLDVEKGLAPPDQPVDVDPNQVKRAG
jgi:hypothetical protein